MMKYIAMVIATFAVAAQAQTQGTPEHAAQLCSAYCTREYADSLDTCNEVCAAAATGVLTDCAPDASASKAEKNAFESNCSYGSALGKGSSCASFCGKISFEHSYAKFFEIGCKRVCKSVVKSHKNNPIINCREDLCSTLRVSLCRTACNYASGFFAATEHECDDC
jgi:hypothetical protein